MKKWAVKLVLLAIAIGLLAIIFWPRTGTTCGSTISDESRDKILTLYYQELDKGQVIRPISYIEKLNIRYSDEQYKPAVEFFGTTKMRVEGESGISVYYKIHLENEFSPRLGQIFIEEKRYQNGKEVSDEASSMSRPWMPYPKRPR